MYLNFTIIIFAGCDCDPVKTSAEICAAGSGVCKCRNNYSGLKCDQCADGFYGYPACRRMHYFRLHNMLTDFMDNQRVGLCRPVYFRLHTR